MNNDFHKNPLDEFDLWNEKKKEINKKIISNNFSFYERTVWWCSLGKNIGSEQNGKNEEFERPVIIFRIFSENTVWVIPLTSRRIIKKSRKEYEIIVNEIIQTADISQLRLISIKRLTRYVTTISYNDFQTIRKYLTQLA